MKVAIVGPYPLPGLPPGGIESVSAFLAAGLGQLDDVDIEVLTVALPGSRAGETSVADRIRLTAVLSSGRLRRPTMYMLERRAILRALRRMAPDIVHVQGQNFYAPAALASGLPTVISVHGMLATEAHISDERSRLLDRLSKRVRAQFNARFEAKSLRDARELIVNNPYVAETIRPLTSARLHWLDNPIDDRFFDVPDDAHPRRVFFAGSMQPRKGVHLMIEAARILKSQGTPIELRIAGPILDAGYDAEVRQAAVAADLGDVVRFLGVIDDATLLQEYARCALVLMASKEETSPMFLQQAMAAGKPAVSTDVGGVRYVVEDHVTGRLAAAEDASVIAAAIGDVVSDEAVRQRMSAAARTTAEARFRAKSVAERTIHIYEVILAGRAAVEPAIA